MRIRLLLTGAQGQLAQAIAARTPAGVELLALGRDQLDLSSTAACRAAVFEHRPDWVINAGAYTAVDRAESEPELAWAVNAAAPAAFADACDELGQGRLLQLSTDFVFNGQQGSPYRSDQSVAPLGVYGASKAAGESAVLQGLGGLGRAYVVRTSWVYGTVGRNFCLTMLKLHRDRSVLGEPLAVVADQVGCPTATTGSRGLASACWRLIEQVDTGHVLPPLLHWSDAGAASWYDFAVAIGDIAAQLGLLEKPAAVHPISTAQYPTPARRPSYSLLDCNETHACLELQPLHWREALTGVLAQLV